ncbi:hypothetical protein OTU49_014457 [Cherax quadricarinatus]|uniref:Uncharacterized protein n=1 Tax=Cherax quadricarinatus TaxID=27406 RepID=A0AAW0VQD3_CHEQU
MTLFRRVAHIDFENYCDNHDPNNYECTSKKKKKKKKEKIPQGERCPATNNDELGEWHYVCNKKKKKKKKFGETLNVPSNNKFPERSHLPDHHESLDNNHVIDYYDDLYDGYGLFRREGKPRKIKKKDDFFFFIFLGKDKKTKNEKFKMM